MQEVRFKSPKNMKNRWMRLTFLVLIWLLIWSLFKDFSRVKRGFSRVDEAQSRLIEVQKENNELRLKIGTVQTEYYREKLMRDKLNLQLPGETVVVLSDRGTNDGEEESEGETSPMSNWEMWWEVIK